MAAWNSVSYVNKLEPTIHPNQLDYISSYLPVMTNTQNILTHLEDFLGRNFPIGEFLIALLLY